MIRKTNLVGLLAAVSIFACAPALGQTQSSLAVKDQSGAVQQLCNVTSATGNVLVQCADLFKQGAQVGPSNPVDIVAAALPLPTGASTAAGVAAIVSALGSPFQAGGAIANTAFGISGTLPAFAATPMFNIGTAPSLTIGTLPALPTGANAIGSITNLTFGAKLQDASGNAFGTSGNPVFISGGGGGGSTTTTYNTTAPTLTNGATAPLQADVNGNLKVAVQGGATATPTGSAGTPNAAVVTIQGIAGGVALPISGAVSITGTPAVSIPGAVALAAGSASIGSIGNTAFGIAGTLPGFAATPTFNLGTAPSLTIGTLPALPTGANAIGSITNLTFGAKLQDASGNAFGTSGNPVFISGGGGGGSTTTTYNTTAPTLTNGATAPLQADVNGNLKVAVQGGATATPTGSAGTPNVAVVTIQGIAGGVAQPVSGAVSITGTPTVSIPGAVTLGAGSAAIGSVTANAGTNLNTSSLALETGGNLAGIYTKVSGTLAVSNASLPLPAGAATSANQNVTAAGTTATSAQAMQGVAGGVAIDTVVKSAAVDRGAIIGFSGATWTTTAGSPNITLVVAPTLGSIIFGHQLIEANVPAGDVITSLVSGTANTAGAVYALATGTGVTAGTAVAGNSNGPQLLIPANTSRRGNSFQDQSSTGSIYINGSAGTATPDYHSLLIAPGGYYENSPAHTGTGAVYAMGTSPAISLYSREW